MAKRVHVAGIFVSCMSSVARAFVRTPNSRAALTIHAKLFTFTRVKRVHARVHTHACVKFKVSGTVHIFISKDMPSIFPKGNVTRSTVTIFIYKDKREVVLCVLSDESAHMTYL